MDPEIDLLHSELCARFPDFNNVPISVMGVTYLHISLKERSFLFNDFFITLQMISYQGGQKSLNLKLLTYSGSLVQEETFAQKDDIIDYLALGPFNRLSLCPGWATDILNLSGELRQEYFNDKLVKRHRECQYYSRNEQNSSSRCPNCQILSQIVKAEEHVSQEDIKIEQDSDLECRLEEEKDFDLSYDSEESFDLLEIEGEEAPPPLPPTFRKKKQKSESRKTSHKAGEPDEEILTAECSVCLHIFERAGRLESHLKGHKARDSYSKLMECPYCSLALAGADINPHFVKEHDPDRGICIECFKVCKRDYLATHYKTHAAYENRHKNKEKKICPHCGKPFL